MAKGRHLWQPGQSGNPGGRPKHKPFAEALAMEIAAAGEDHKILRQIARRALEIAAKHEDDRVALAAMEFLANRTDGKVQTAAELSLEGQDGRQMTIRWES